jgi:hypothetical protein
MTSIVMTEADLNWSWDEVYASVLNTHNQINVTDRINPPLKAGRMIESNTAASVQSQLSPLMEDSDVTVYFLDLILPNSAQISTDTGILSVRIFL